MASALHRLQRSRFLVLLVFLLGLFVIQPMLPLGSDGASAVHIDVALAAVLLASLWSLSRSRAVLFTGLALVAGALVAAGLARTTSSRAMLMVALLCALAWMLFTVGMLLWHLVREKQISTETILGGICAYFLLGCLWALLYSLLERLAPGSFAGGSGPLFTGEDTGRLLAPDLLYYSIFVLTTIGPQDLHPVARPVLAWTGVEAMIGQLYLVVFISRLVGLHSAGRSSGA